MAKFEIELRGLLTPSNKEKLEKFLVKCGKLIKQYERTQWIFGLSHDKKIDLRIKETNGKREFSLKVGNVGNINRKEISIAIAEEDFEQAFEFLKYLGHEEGLKAVRNANIYKYEGIEWAIVEVPGHSSYFEAEKLVESEEDGKIAEEEIREIAGKLGLVLFTPDETIEYIRILDKEANKVFKTK